MAPHEACLPKAWSAMSAPGGGGSTGAPAARDSEPHIHSPPSPARLQRLSITNVSITDNGRMGRKGWGIVPEEGGYCIISK